MTDAPKENQNPNNIDDHVNNNGSSYNLGLDEGGINSGSGNELGLTINTGVPPTNAPDVPDTPAPQPEGVRRFFPPTDGNVNGGNQR
jgi:hypothetical protein